MIRSDGRALLLSVLALAPTLACSSVPVFPRQQGGASLNLATEAHVNAVKAEILQRELPRRLDSMLADDRRRLADLQEGAAARGERLDGLNEEVALLSETLTALAEDVQQQAELFGEVADQLQQTSARLDAAIATLPAETLRQFGEAIRVYLEEREAEEPEAPAEEPGAADTAASDTAPAAQGAAVATSATAR